MEYVWMIYVAPNWNKDYHFGSLAKNPDAVLEWLKAAGYVGITSSQHRGMMHGTMSIGNVQMQFYAKQVEVFN